jgi:hypothetical protein
LDLERVDGARAGRKENDHCCDKSDAPSDMLAAMGESFVEDVEAWRERLASKSRLEGIVDAIVFLRFCEDKSGVRSPPLRASMNDPRIHEALAACVRRMDERFHGWLLGASTERAAEASQANDALVRDAICHFCDVDFRALADETLGRVYESSLERRARGARKSAGVYYTPEHVVRYMVDGTIGQLLERRRDGASTRIRILDPACGSGSFLLGAFERLVAWHDERGARPLDVERRIEVLLDGVFGVDLDPRAVEVTKLSLALAAIGGRTPDPTASLRALARLDDNIRCGNSLVATEFDYAASFADVFAEGGFDVVLGNPPYVSYGGRQAVELPAETRRYFERHYESGGWATAHSLFMERSAKHLSRGLVSFIVPDQVGHLAGYRGLREILGREGHVTEVRYWGENVFKGVVTPSLTFVLDRATRAKVRTTRVLDGDGSEHRVRIEGGEPWTAPRGSTLLDKLRQKSISIRPYLADCGVRTTDAKKQVVRLLGARGKCVPVLEGRQIGRYSCAPPEVAVRLAAGPRVYMSRAEKYAKARFLIRQTAAYPIVGPREHATYFRNSLHALYAPDNGWDVRYVVGLLNSKLLRFAYVATVREARQRAFPQVKLGPLGALPIRALRLDVQAEKQQHDGLVDLVARMLDLKHELGRATAETKRDALRARADELDLRIDRAVFGIYELTDGEIANVEETVGTLAAPP